MLKPIKTFFNYLQKNANTSNIFRFSNDLNMSDEINASSLEGEGGSFEEDPLTDPLAIDDFETGAETDLQIESIGPNNTAALVNDFIFVDIEKLKCNGEENLENAKNKVKYSKGSEYSDINGNKKHVDEKVKNRAKIVNDKKQDSKTQKSGDPNELSEKSNESTEKTCSLSKTNKLENVSMNENEINKNVDNISYVISANNSEPDEIEEVTDTSEVRSDGSDSGLGLDILRNISVIEKSLSNLTPSKSSLKRKSDLLHEDQPKKQKQGINFGNVTVFYFPRCQGFGCVPTQGGSTLGMTSKHAYKKTFSLSEHAIEQRRLNRLKMTGNELSQCSSSSDESKSEDEISENSLSEADSEAYGFLQPVTARQRRAILKGAGVRKIDIFEKDECRQLRTSREVCGCSCRGFCDPDTCECSLAGIKCQVDRLKPHEFPCGCTRDGCANVNGRVEFNPARVKTHFIHTIMRLELEKRQELSEDSTSVIQSLPSSKWWMHLQSSQSGVNTNASYNNYVYNNGGTTSQYSGKIPPISMMSSPIANSESLDLHYAYRDEYTNNLTLSTESNNSSFNNSSNDYYSNYNYMSTSTPSNNTVHSGYHISSQMNYHQHHHSSHNQIHMMQQQTFSPDCQYSSYTSTNGAYRADSLSDLNGINTHNYMTSNNYSPSMHNGAVTNRINYPNIMSTQTLSTTSSTQEILPSTENYCSVSPSAKPNSSELSSSTATSTTQTNNNQIESNENLSEIIKKSIVESVTA